MSVVLRTGRALRRLVQVATARPALTVVVSLLLAAVTARAVRHRFRVFTHVIVATVAARVQAPLRATTLATSGTLFFALALSRYLGRAVAPPPPARTDRRLPDFISIVIQNFATGPAAIEDAWVGRLGPDGSRRFATEWTAGACLVTTVAMGPVLVPAL